MARTRKTKGRARQPLFQFMNQARRRKKPGPKRDPRSGVPHRTRNDVNPRHPMHLTWKLVRGKPGLRNWAAFEVLKRAFVGVKGRDGFRVVEFSVQEDHLHLIVEGESKESVATGMQALGIRISKGLNKHWRTPQGTARARRVLDRYHRTDLNSPTQVRNCLRYVLQNTQKHCREVAQLARDLVGEAGERLRELVDPLTSAPYFTGWVEPVGVEAISALSPVSRASTWLMRVGWRARGGGAISLFDAPRS